MMNGLKLWEPAFPSLFPADFIDEFFDDFFKPRGTRDHLALRQGFPKGDIYIKDNKLILELALAGYSRDQLNVSIEDNVLVVSATKGDDVKNNNSQWRKTSAFKKAFPDLANKWDIAKAEATYQDGLLQIVVPLLESKAEVVKKIEIR